MSNTNATTHASGWNRETSTQYGNAATGLLSFAHLINRLPHEYLLWALAALLLALTTADPAQIAHYPSLVDWPTIAALTGLLVLTKGIESSGYLRELGMHLIVYSRSGRSLALFLVVSAALLATVLTNDIALFILVPLTLTLRRLTNLPITRLIVFEALAVNAGSTLTPIGNPQNLFLWNVSQASFVQFAERMLPLVVLLLGALLLLTAIAFTGERIQIKSEESRLTLDKRLFAASLALFGPFVALTDVHQPGPGLAAMLLIYLIAFRSVLTKIDWPLILLFILMFIDLRLIADLNLVRAFLRHVGLSQPGHLFLTGVASSQIISNVPAAILLEQYSKNWHLLAYAVNVGGFGFALGSLANLIALRLAQNKKIWLTFHLYSVPFLIVVGALVYAWLFWIRAGLPV